MKLVATKQEYLSEDAGGYKFKVVAELDPEYGWSASVTMLTHGLKTAEAAIDALRSPVEAFLRQLGASK